jgi:hypothetical protein
LSHAACPGPVLDKLNSIPKEPTPFGHQRSSTLCNQASDLRLQGGYLERPVATATKPRSRSEVRRQAGAVALEPAGITPPPARRAAQPSASFLVDGLVAAFDDLETLRRRARSDVKLLPSCTSTARATSRAAVPAISSTSAMNLLQGFATRV